MGVTKVSNFRLISVEKFFAKYFDDLTARGNIRRFSTAEYNFYRDPEAAMIVLEEITAPIKLVPWEMFMKYRASSVSIIIQGKAIQ